MHKVNNLVVGLGEVGAAVQGMFDGDVFGIDMDTEIPEGLKCNCLHVCIPYSNSFHKIVIDYVNQFEPSLVVVHSTVPLGTTMDIGMAGHPGGFRAVHSPVRGKHPEIMKGLSGYTKYVGCDDSIAKERWAKFVDDAFPDVCFVDGSRTTEAMKLASLAKYCAYLAVADELKAWSDLNGVDYEKLKDWDLTQNQAIDQFYPNMKLPILDPPDGKIGGHCVLPVTKMFLEEGEYGTTTPLISEAYKTYSGV